jgi:lipopolysaccharide transport system permease protein/teichoic acid transport system permease protein
MMTLRRLVAFLLRLHRYRGAIWALAKHDLFTRYVGTLGGPLWAVFHPLATVAIYWFVFSVGFKATGPAGIPFVIYFITGLLPWLLFNNTVLSSVSVVTRNVHLVKKTVFPTEVLPVVNLVSESLTHVAMVAVVGAVLWHYGYHPTLSLFQVGYFYIALAIFVLGLSWLLSSLHVFHRDIGQGLAVFLSLWFWLTPIVWTGDMIPENYRWLVQLNPLLYVVDGYRRALLHQSMAWPEISAASYFWLITIVVFFSGAQCFSRLKPHFADVV